MRFYRSLGLPRPLRPPGMRSVPDATAGHHRLPDVSLGRCSPCAAHCRPVGRIQQRASHSPALPGFDAPFGVCFPRGFPRQGGTISSAPRRRRRRRVVFDGLSPSWGRFRSLPIPCGERSHPRRMPPLQPVELWRRAETGWVRQRSRHRLPAVSARCAAREAGAIRRRRVPRGHHINR